MNAEIAAEYSLTPTQLLGDLKVMVEAKNPLMIWGPPGVGKSMIVRQAAEELGYRYIDIRALLMDPVDLRGLPTIDDQGRTQWATPDFLPPTDSDENWLLNLEELTAAPPSMQAALYQLVLDRGIGEYRLPPGAAIVACGNRVSDRGVAVQMPTPLASRFTHITVDCDPAEWTAWAATNDLHPDVVFFIHARPDLLHQFDPKDKDVTFPCPRTWEMVSAIMDRGDGMSAQGREALIVGTVGKGAGLEFTSFLQVKADLPSPHRVLHDPDNAPTLHDKPSSLLALCGSLYRLADDTNFDAIEHYAGRIRPEVGEFLMGSCLKRKPELEHTRANIRWLSRNTS